MPLHELKDWEFTENEIHCKHDYDFKVVYCDIEMEGREVNSGHSHCLKLLELLSLDCLPV